IVAELEGRLQVVGELRVEHVVDQQRVDLAVEAAGQDRRAARAAARRVDRLRAERIVLPQYVVGDGAHVAGPVRQIDARGHRERLRVVVGRQRQETEVWIGRG